jgi:hypothetical protein
LPCAVPKPLANIGARLQHDELEIFSTLAISAANRLEVINDEVCMRKLAAQGLLWFRMTIRNGISIRHSRSSDLYLCLPINFLALALTAPVTIKEVLKETRGTVGQDNLSLEQVRSLRIPFVSLVEQNRIVAKVVELMALCDRLETSLTATTRRRLLDALLASALAPADARELGVALDRSLVRVPFMCWD